MPPDSRTAPQGDAESTSSSGRKQEEKHSDDESLTREESKPLSEEISGIREFLFVGITCTAQFTTQVGLGQTLAILHVVGEHFNVDNPGRLAWLISGYSLTVGTFILVAGRLGDVFGYKRMMVIGYFWFALWTMIGGLAVYSNHVLFIFARVLQGIGPSIILPNGLAILGATYRPGKRKDMVFALFGAAAPTGAVTGFVFAGLFNLAWWPWTYWSFAIALFGLGFGGMLLIPPMPPDPKHQGQPWFEKFKDLDPLGGLTGVTALILINFAWNQAAVVLWRYHYVYICLILGFVFLAAFFYIELRVTRAPLIPFSALSSEVGFVLATVACGWGCFGIWVFYIWQFAETLRGATPIQAAAWLCPVAIAGACASISTGILLSKLRPAWVMTIALTAFTIGTVLIMTAPVRQIYWAQFFVCTIIIPFGMDMSFPAATLILSNAVSKEHQGIGASLVNTVVNYSISLALGFAGTVEKNVNHGGMTPAEELEGFRGAWYMGVGLSGLGLALCLVFLAKSYWDDWRTKRSKETTDDHSA